MKDSYGLCPLTAHLSQLGLLELDYLHIAIVTVLFPEGVGLPLLVLLRCDQAQLGGQLAHQV